MFDAISYLVLRLCASPPGDAPTPLRQRLMYAIGAFFLSHPLYTIYFASQMTLSFFWPRHWCVAGSGGAVTGDYLDAAGRVPLAYLHVYRHDAGDGVAGR
ncbi:hypothetical protein MJ572_17885 [Escherichia coli]|nr:hypothetical protein MJ572_17885 [Escherichia coli]